MMTYKREIDRGVVTLQAQVREMSADLAELKGQSHEWQQAHDRRHGQDEHDRISARRWIIGTGIAGVAAMATAIGLLVDIAAHLHP
jgi:hypothetical protein